LKISSERNNPGKIKIKNTQKLTKIRDPGIQKICMSSLQKEAYVSTIQCVRGSGRELVIYRGSGNAFL